MISSIDVYVLTISTFLSMIVAVVVAMKALGHLISPSCPQPLFQSEIKRKAINMKTIFFLSSRKFHWWFALSLVFKTRVFGTRKLPIKNCSTTTLKLKPNQLVCCAVFRWPWTLSPFFFLLIYSRTAKPLRFYLETRLWFIAIHWGNTIVSMVSSWQLSNMVKASWPLWRIILF